MTPSVGNSVSKRAASAEPAPPEWHGWPRWRYDATSAARVRSSGVPRARTFDIATQHPSASAPIAKRARARHCGSPHSGDPRPSAAALASSAMSRHAARARSHSQGKPSNSAATAYASSDSDAAPGAPSAQLTMRSARQPSHRHICAYRGASASLSEASMARVAFSETSGASHARSECLARCSTHGTWFTGHA